MSEKKGIDVGGGITLDDDEFATTPGLDFSISKKGTSVGARVQKPISKIDKENINSAIGFDIKKENEDSSFGLSGTKQGKSKRLELRFSKSFKKGGLKEWFRQKWVDIGSKRKDGSYAKCGRSKLAADRKRKYPKCVPAAKAARMTDSQRRSAVARKRSKPQGVGGKPTNVSTFTKKYYGGMIET
jgi:hypothetical protein|tara:strand:+ start:3951 stop:4505 length:555 start_codon:yes stop_codon:yes gene_type:complete